MASFILNNLLQSPLKGIARGTQNFLWDQGPFPLQFGERIMRNSAGLALEDGPHRKVQRIQVRAPWRPVFLADERRDVGLNPPLGHSWAIWGCRVLLEVQGAPLKCSCAQGNSSSSKMSKMYRCLFNFTPEGTKTKADLPVAVTAAQSITEVEFWRRLTLLPSTDAFLPQTWSF